MLYIVSNIFLMGYGDVLWIKKWDLKSHLGKMHFRPIWKLLSNMQSELDSLKQRVVELLAENAEIKAENAKLRQAMEENEARFVKLEQSDKEKAKLIAELNSDVGKIKQEQIAINVSAQDGTSVMKSSTRSELQVTSQSSISPSIEGNSENSSDVIHVGSESSEDRQDPTYY